MFWFRPQALRKLFEEKWEWEEFNAEPHHVDGGLAHVLERLIAYTAQDAGFMTRHVMCLHQAAHNYTWLEYKLQKLAALIPTGDFRHQTYLLSEGRSGDRAVNLNRPVLPPGRAVAEVFRSLRRSFLKRVNPRKYKKKFK
jgi:rhamnosyltransferase